MFKKSWIERLVDYLHSREMTFKILKHGDKYDVACFNGDFVWVTSTSDSAEDAIRLAVEGFKDNEPRSKKELEDMLKKKSYLEQLKEHCSLRGWGIEQEVVDNWVSYRVIINKYGNGKDLKSPTFSVLEDMFKWALDELKKQEFPTPHEDALRAYCEERGYSVFRGSYGPSSVSSEVTWYLRVGDEKDLHITQVWENPIRNSEQAFSALLSGIKEKKQIEAKKKLEEFCKQEGLRFVAMGPESVGPESVWVGGFGLSGHVFASYQKAITRLEEMKNNKEEKWEDKDRSELEKFCTEEGLRCDEVRLINQSIMITRKENFTLNDNLWFHGKTLQDAMEIALKMLEQQKKDGITFWSTGPYERKVRELCERKGWTIQGFSFNPGSIGILELNGFCIDSFEGGESGFKEVWDKIEKLKELLS